MNIRVDLKQMELTMVFSTMDKNISHANLQPI